MENASRALLMAGGVLIAIIIISVLIRTYGNIANFQRQQLTAEEVAQIEEFNKEYTKYDKQYVYGTEVITVINKSLNDKENKITLKIKFNDGYSYYKTEYVNGKKRPKVVTIKPGKEWSITNDDDDYISDFINEPENQEDSLKNRAFYCEVSINKNTGRVDKVTFTEKEIK